MPNKQIAIDLTREELEGILPIVIEAGAYFQAAAQDKAVRCSGMLEGLRTRMN